MNVFWVVVTTARMQPLCSRVINQVFESAVKSRSRITNPSVVNTPPNKKVCTVLVLQCCTKITPLSSDTVLALLSLQYWPSTAFQIQAQITVLISKDIFLYIKRLANTNKGERQRDYTSPVVILID